MLPPRHRLQGAVFRRLILRLALDVVLWVLALGMAVALRYDLRLPDGVATGMLKRLPIFAAIQAVCGIAMGLYRRRWRYGSFDELLGVAVSAAIGTVISYVVNARFLDIRYVPRSAVLIGGFIGLVFLATTRYVWRAFNDLRQRPSSLHGQPTIIFGAGEAGTSIVRQLMRTPTSPLVPVALLDDDPAKRNLHISGIRVEGGLTDLVALAEKHGATMLLLAIPSLDKDGVRDVVRRAREADLDVKVLPAVSDLFDSHGPRVSDIRSLTPADFLRRLQISTDINSIAGYVTGRRVMVTGAGGSIGSELCRQLAKLGPSQLVMLDRDESALHGVQLSIEGRALLDSPNTLLADIRDRARMFEVMESCRPDVVFHAAALKHLPLLERYPEEAWKTNVLGTLNVLDACRAAKVDRFVNISTDKGANPISILGHSKRVAERLTSDAATRLELGAYLSVRFGNVLASRGSVLTTFQQQIENGGPVTVTHPDVTRFFMTIPEAVELVIQAGAIGQPGEVLILDMGDPVRIVDVARQMIDIARSDAEIVFTGLRPGEKLHEELIGSGERDERPMHPLIAQVAVPPLSPDVFDRYTPDEVYRGIACGQL